MTVLPGAVRVRVPASSANLGPGFDVLAAALSLEFQVLVEPAGSFELRTDLRVPRDRSNLLVRAFEVIRSAATYRFTVSSTIPLSGGLGSSAAAVVAGLLAADALTGGDGDVFDAAVEMEGHPDNVAAALYGGFVICGDGPPAKIPAPSGLAALLVVPEEPVPTSRARAALPKEVPLPDAVFNISRACLLTVGVASSDQKLIARGLQDRLHQPYRSPLYPRSAEMVANARSFGALGATISGAGPTVLVWCASAHLEEARARIERETAGWASVLSVSFADEGAQVERGPV